MMLTRKSLACALLVSFGAAAQSLPPQVVTRAGTASTSVVNVQGNASGTPIPVTGTLSVSGAADTVGNSATFNGNSVCATVLLTGQPGAGFALQAGTLAATLTPSVSEDATPATPGCTGGNYTATKFVTDASGNTSATLVVTNPNSYTHYGVVTLSGSRCARVCTTSYTSGSAAGNLVASVAPSPPPAAGADVTDRAGRILGQLTDGASAITPTKTGQLPTALDGAGYLKVHEQGTATVSGTVTANAGSGTMAVSAAALPLPSGAATAAKQPALGTAGASSTDVLSVQGIASGTALPVSAASLPLPSGASTAAKQPALGTAGTASADVITVQGITSMTPLKVDNSGVTQPVSGTVAATQSGTWTVQPGNTANTTAWKVDGSAVTQPVSGSVTVSGTATVSQATAANLNAQVQGAAASGASKSGNPVQVGGVFNTTQPTVTTGQAVEAQSTARGALIVAKGVDGFALDANQSVNVAQLAGTATDTNSGVKSAGTLRVVLATDQPALTNKLLVTPDSVALPANQSVNVSQVNGVTTSVGNGISGTGVQRVTIASDSTGQVTLAAGSAVIGHVIADTGSTTAVTQATASNLNAQVVGSIASGGSDSGNPVKTGAVFNSTQPTVTTGQRVDSQATARGAQIVATGADTFNVTVNAALPAGTALIGKTGIDQTTPGTTNAIALSTLGANAVATGNGTSSTGTLRVAVASDNTAFGVKPTDGTNTITVKAASTAPATTDTAQVVTLSPNPSPQCTSWVAINQTTSTKLVTGTASQKLYICAIMIVSATAQNVSLVEGTGTVCATGTAGLMGNTTASIALIDNGGFSLAAGLPFGKSKTAADDLCLFQSGAGNISGFISYVSAP